MTLPKLRKFFLGTASWLVVRIPFWFKSYMERQKALIKKAQHEHRLALMYANPFAFLHEIIPDYADKELVVHGKIKPPLVKKEQ